MESTLSSGENSAGNPRTLEFDQHPSKRASPRIKQELAKDSSAEYVQYFGQEGKHCPDNVTSSLTKVEADIKQERRPCTAVCDLRRESSDCDLTDGVSQKRFTLTMEPVINEYDQDGSESLIHSRSASLMLLNEEKLELDKGTITDGAARAALASAKNLVINRDRQCSSNLPQKFAVAHRLMCPTEVQQDMEEDDECKIEIQDHVLCKYERAVDENKAETGEACKYAKPSKESNPTSDAKVFKCSRCSFSSMHREMFVQHMKIVHTNTIHKCSECEYVTKYRQELTFHLIRKHDKNTQSYQCTKCDYKTKIKKYVNRHMKRRHDISYKYQSGLERKAETGEICKGTNQSEESDPTADAKVFICFRCGFSSTLRGSFLQHMKKVHTNAMYKCSECDYVTKYRQELTSHFVRKHDEDTEPYKCTNCDYTTKLKKYFNCHMKKRHHIKNTIDDCRRSRLKESPGKVKRRSDSDLTDNVSQKRFTLTMAPVINEYDQDGNESLIHSRSASLIEEKLELDKGTIRDGAARAALASAKNLVINRDRQCSSNSPQTFAAAHRLMCPIEVKQEMEEDDEYKIEAEDHVLCEYKCGLDAKKAATDKVCKYTKPSKESNPNSDVKVFICFRCGFSSTLRESFVQHMKKVHTSAMYKCSECEYVSKYRQEVTCHFVKKHDVNTEPYKCTKCDYTTKLKKYFNWHMKKRQHFENTIDDCRKSRRKESHSKVKPRKQHCRPSRVACDLRRESSDCDLTDGVSQKRFTLTMEPVINEYDQDGSESLIHSRSVNLMLSNEEKLELDKGTITDGSARSTIASAKNLVINRDRQCSSNLPQTFAAAHHSMCPIEVKQEMKEDDECKIEIQDHVLCKYERGVDETKAETGEACKYTKPNKESNPSSDAKVFKCFMCNFSSTHREIFGQHMKSVHTNTIHKCSECEYVTKYRQELTFHLIRKHDKNTESYQCTKCDYKTKIKKYFNRHMKRRHDVSYKYQSGLNGKAKTGKKCKRTNLSQETDPTADAKVFICFRCGFSSTLRGSFVQHMSKVHTNAMYKCSECDYVTKYRQELTSHFVMRHDENTEPYKCTRCDYTTKLKKYFNCHMKKRHHVENTIDDCRKESPGKFKLRNAEPKIHRCSACDFTTRGRNSLREHFRVKHDTGAVSIQCPECDYATKLKSNLNVHYKRKHDCDAELFRCTACTYTTKVKSLLTQHFRLKHDGSAEVFECTECGYATKRKDNLAWHTKAIHGDDTETYRCTLCDYTTKVRTYLAQHETRTHSTQVFKCAECDFTTKQRARLGSHFKLRHDGDAEVFKCVECDYTTKSKGTLNKHMKFKHEGRVEMFVCRECGYATKSKKSLDVHCKCRHGDGGEMFECTKCEYVTGRMRNLKRHTKAVHGTDIDLI